MWPFLEGCYSVCQFLPSHYLPLCTSQASARTFSPRCPSTFCTSQYSACHTTAHSVFVPGWAMTSSPARMVILGSNISTFLTLSKRAGSPVCLAKIEALHLHCITPPPHSQSATITVLLPVLELCHVIGPHRSRERPWPRYYFSSPGILKYQKN